MALARKSPRRLCVPCISESLEQRVLLSSHLIADAKSPPVLATPTGFKASPDPIIGVDLQWNAVPNADSYEVERAPFGSVQFTPLDWQAYGGGNDAYDTSVAPTQKYDYRIIAMASEGFADSAPAAVTVRAPLAPPDANATAVSSSEVVLSWDMNGDPACSVLISRSSDGVNFGQIAVASSTASSFQDKGLADATEYTYQLRADRRGEITAADVTDPVDVAPIAPARLAAWAVNTNEIDLSWTNLSRNADGVDILRSDDGGKSFNNIESTYNTPGAPAISTFADQTVQASHQYLYRIDAYFDPPAPNNSPVGVIPTPVDSPPTPTVSVTTPVAAITNVVATGVSPTEIDLSWTTVLKDPSAIQVYRSLDGHTFTNLTSHALAANATTFKNTGLQPDAHYYYEVRAVRQGVPTAFTPTDGYSLPLAPTNLRAVLDGPRNVELTWTNSDPNASGFYLEVAAAGNTTFSYLDNVTTTSYQYTLYNPAASYQYRVSAYSDQQNQSSLPSNVATLTNIPPFAGFPDPTFNKGFPAGEMFINGTAQAMLVAPDGKILIAGSQQDASSLPGQYWLTRLNADGSRDVSFGVDGMEEAAPANLTEFSSLAIQKDGKILAGGVLNYDQLVIARFLSNGTPDPSFGASGIELVSASNILQGGVLEGATALAMQSNGAILIGAQGAPSFAVGPDVIARVTSAGALDTSFGSGGLATFAEGGGPFLMALSADGKIIVADGSDIGRLMPNGATDTSFGKKGLTVISDDLSSLAVQPDGKVLIGTDTWVKRLNSGGALDRTFGTQGEVDVPATFLLQQSNGDLIAGGADSQYSIGFARLTPTGSVDTTYGGGGTVTNLLDGFSVYGSGPAAAAVGPDGSLFLIGTPRLTFQLALVHYTPAGMPDTHFGFFGDVRTPDGLSSGVKALALQSDGKIIAAGGLLGPSQPTPTQGALVRYNADGSIDASFGKSGRFLLSAAGNSLFNAVVIEPNGDIVAGGFGTSHGVQVFAIARFLPTGALDPAFGTGGVVLTSFVDANGQACTSLAIQSNGDILAVGSTSSEIAVAAYLPSGALDPHFGTAGKVLLDPGGDPVKAAGMVLNKAGKIDIATTIDFDFGVIQLQSNGSLDNSFGTHGVGTIAVDSPVSTIAGAIALDAKGNLVVAGIANGNMALAIFLPNGQTGNLVFVGETGSSGGIDISPNSIAIQPDGGILVGGTDGNAVAVRVIGGNLDPDFGGDNIGIPDVQILDVPQVFTVNALLLDAHGQILAGAGGVFRLNG